MNTFIHTGDLGDCIYALPAVERLGGGGIHLLSRPVVTRPFTPDRLAAITPLLEFQSYVEFVSHDEPARPTTHDFTYFRNGACRYGDTLVSRHARWLGLDGVDGSRPWLCAPRSPDSKDRVVIHRSPRYHNPHFPWKAIGDFYGDRLLALGQPEEVEQLRKSLKRNVEHRATRDFLEIASLIGGADLFIGNQSSPMAVAIGLGVPFIQETCEWQPDCLFARSNAQYVYDGGVVLPALGQGEDRAVIPIEARVFSDERVAPPGGWKVLLNGRSYRDHNLDALCKEVVRDQRQHGVSTSYGDVKERALEEVRRAACRKFRAANFGRLDRVLAEKGLDYSELPPRVNNHAVMS